MTLESALLVTEILLGCALLQQSLEHCVGPRDEQRVAVPRALLCVALALGFQPLLVECLLLGLSALTLRRFDGPYNGGSDRMSVLILICVCLSHIAPTLRLQEASFGYLGVQLVLSYAMAGWVKAVNPEWRNGEALRKVFARSAYPVAENLRALAGAPRLMHRLGWAVVLFEIAFPLALLNRSALAVALVLAALFHAANACLFGLNRFLWIWLCAYPSLWWLQGRLFSA